jgi:competence protein ComEC
MDQISISTIFKRHLVLCRAITNNDYSKLREEQFPQKELNVAVALILGQKQDLSPDILQDYQYGCHTYFICRITCWIPVAVLTFILNQFPTHKRLSP